MSAIKAGLIGCPLGHSMSPYIHERIMEASGIFGKYELYEIAPEELPKYAPILMRELTGFNVTIPHKVAILPFLDDVAPMVKEYGAANTVCGKIGYNTDVDGFLSCGVPMKDKKVLLLGAGGVARMMAIEALKAGADLSIWARSPEKALVLIDECKAKGYDKVTAAEKVAGGSAFDTILNGTPCGMWPNVHDGIPEAGLLADDGTFFDTIYNPCPTKTCLRYRAEGKTAVSGLKMLLNQAIAAEKIWAPDAHFDEARLSEILPDVRKKLWEKNPIKLVFTGFMGAGKTTVGRRTADQLKIPFIDLDDEIVKVAGCPIREIFEKDGEEAFRKMEHEILKRELEKQGSAVISLGGGVLTNEENEKLLLQSKSMLIYLKVTPQTIWERVKNDRSRPLLDAKDADTAYKNMVARLESREPTYERGADVVLPADEDVEVILAKVTKLFET
ncbi:MAG: hypothetical protein IKD90_10960 [Clostridiales bacterium]|nr:hypothetical protein [Clostridiales bacterium]